jgi:hypothetical protein
MIEEGKQSPRPDGRRWTVSTTAGEQGGAAMKRSMFVVTTVLALTAALLVTPALAGKGCHEKHDHAGCRGGGVKHTEDYDKHVAAFLEKYGERIKAVYEEHEEKKTEIAEKMGALKDEIDAIVKAEGPDLKKLESKLEKMSDLHFEMTKLKFRMHKKARELVDNETDRAGFDRHFAMEVIGCCGACAHAKSHSKHSEGTSLKGEHSGCRAIFIGEKDGHAEVRILGGDDMLEWAPGTLGEKHVEVLLDEEGDGVRRIKVLVDGEHGEGERYEFMLDDEDLDGDVHKLVKKIRAPGGLERIERHGEEIIQKMHVIPGGDAEAFIWKEWGGGAGPF